MYADINGVANVFGMPAGKGTFVTRSAPLRWTGVLSPMSPSEAAMTFVVTATFAAPIGAVLTLYLLTRTAHTVARGLGAGTLAWLALVWAF